VGIDLAWAEPHGSGVAVIDEEGMVRRASGNIFTSEEICTFGYLDGDEDAVIAIDASLIVKNSQAQRPVERQLTSIFGPYDAGPIPPIPVMQRFVLMDV